MKSRIKPLTMTLLSTAAGVATVLSGMNVAEAHTSRAESSHTAGEASVVAAAKPAGSLTIYGALTSANGTALQTAFEKFDPAAHVSVVTGGTGDLVTRIDAEAKANSLHADVILLADPTVMPALRQLGVLSSYTPPQAKQLPTSLKGTDWVGAFTFHNVIIYHKGMSLPVPTSWTDLKKPIYKNQLELGDPSYSGTTLGMVGYLSQHDGWSFFKALRTNNASIQSSTNTVGTDVASGRYDVGISLDSVANSLIAGGSPIGMVWPKDGAVPVPAPVSITTGHVNALSKAFVNWLLSPAGQKEVSSIGLAPALGSSKLVPKTAKMANVNWVTIGHDRTKTINQFESIFSK